MKRLIVLFLMAFCVVLSAGCAQLLQLREPAVDTTGAHEVVSDGETIPARLDARWSSALVGMPVESSTGASLGRVQDVVVDGYGHSAFAILSYRGMADRGTKYAAVPWEVVAEMLNRDRLVVDRLLLEKAPALASSGAEARNGAWRRDAELYWDGKVASAR